MATCWGKHTRQTLRLPPFDREDQDYFARSKSDITFTNNGATKIRVKLPLRAIAKCPPPPKTPVRHLRSQSEVVNIKVDTSESAARRTPRRRDVHVRDGSVAASGSIIFVTPEKAAHRPNLKRPFPFLALPLELRRLVYKYAVPLPDTYDFYDLLGWKVAEALNATSLLLTCAQIHDETMDHIYSGHLRFTSNIALMMFLDRSSQRARRLIKWIEIEISTFAPLVLFAKHLRRLWRIIMHEMDLTRLIIHECRLHISPGFKAEDRKFHDFLLECYFETKSQVVKDALLKLILQMASEWRWLKSGEWRGMKDDMFRSTLLAMLTKG